MACPYPFFLQVSFGVDVKFSAALVSPKSCNSSSYAVISYSLVEGYPGRCCIGIVESVVNGATFRSPATSTLDLPLFVCVRLMCDLRSASNDKRFCSGLTSPIVEHGLYTQITDGPSWKCVVMTRPSVSVPSSCRPNSISIGWRENTADPWLDGLCTFQFHATHSKPSSARTRLRTWLFSLVVDPLTSVMCSTST